MKAHKYWSLGALACMAGCFYTGCKKLMQAHKYFACGSLVCHGHGNLLRTQNCTEEEKS